MLSSIISTMGAMTAFTAAQSIPDLQTPIQGNYTGALRPQIHFSPPTGFMNDPNGCFLDANGIWHLYYQYNPTGIVAGNQHWGHATSGDLYHWQNQKIAISPDNDDTEIFSGSAVVDVDNTSGFFPNQSNGVVAMYTLNSAEAQSQEIAYSVDGGYTFTKYSGNPVIGSNSTQFRDPKVLRYGDDWVVVIAYAQDFTIGIFTSPDLKTWTHQSNFSHHGLLGLQYECPNLIPVLTDDATKPMYILLVSINPGAPLGGSITQYFPGTFNGTHFEAVDGVTRIVDFGKDNYAGQFFYGTPVNEPAIFIPWASNWQYAQQVPTGPLEGWRSSMGLPRKAHLANVTRIGYDLINEPYDLSPILDSVLASNDSLGNGSILLDYSSISSGALYFQANISAINATTASGTLNFTFSSSVSGEQLAGGSFIAGDNPFWINRGGISGFDNPFFSDKFSTNNPISNATFTLEGIIDRSILEVFLDGGTRSATASFFPSSPLDTLSISAGDLAAGTRVSVLVRSLRSAWQGYEVDSGIVLGNISSASRY